jgi:hypothetical protein
MNKLILTLSFITILIISCNKVNNKNVEFPKFYHETPLRYSHWRGLTKWQHKAAHYQDSVGYAHDTILFMDSIKKLILNKKLYKINYHGR